MKRMMILTVALLAIAAVPAKADEAPEPRKDPAKIELPWTVEQIRDAWGKGRYFKYNIESEKGPAGWISTEFTKITEKGFSQTETQCETGGKPKTNDRGEQTWDEWLGKIRDELAKCSEKKDENLKTAVGEFDCTCHSGNERLGTSLRSTKFWLSKSVPGMFLQAEMERKTVGADERDYEKWTLSEMGVPKFDAPWTQAQVFENWKNGATVKYDLASEAGPEGWVSVTFSEVDAEGYTLTRTTKEGDKERSEKPKKDTWSKYLREIALPKHNSTQSEETIEAAGQKWECVVVAHNEERENYKGTTKIWYAKSEPGLFVKMTNEAMRGDKPDSEIWTLSEYKKNK